MGTCTPWATTSDLTGDCAVIEGEGGLDASEAEAALTLASEVLFALSGRQFPGECTEVLHPCPDRRHGYAAEPAGWRNEPVAGVPGAYATGVGSRWLRCRHRRTDRCGCTHLHALDLGVAPVVSVGEVVVDGEVLPAEAYRVDDERELVRLDGQPWPSCTDANDPDAFRVEVTYGTPPPKAGEWAATALACELLKSRHPDLLGECRLPKRVTNVTRQGLSMVVLDPFEMLENGTTGVYECDLFIKAYNPAQLQRRAVVRSPDVGRRARRLGTS